jgi:hypothetical protein
MSDNGNGDIGRTKNDESLTREDNGNGGGGNGDGTPVENDNLNHSYSFEIKRGTFSLRIQLEFRAGQVSHEITDNSNGG